MSIFGLETLIHFIDFDHEITPRVQPPFLFADQYVSHFVRWVGYLVSASGPIAFRLKSFYYDLGRGHLSQRPDQTPFITSDDTKVVRFEAFITSCIVRENGLSLVSTFTTRNWSSWCFGWMQLCYPGASNRGCDELGHGVRVQGSALLHAWRLLWETRAHKEFARQLSPQKSPGNILLVLWLHSFVPTKQHPHLAPSSASSSIWHACSSLRWIAKSNVFHWCVRRSACWHGLVWESRLCCYQCGCHSDGYSDCLRCAQNCGTHNRKRRRLGFWRLPCDARACMSQHLLCSSEKDTDILASSSLMEQRFVVSSVCFPWNLREDRTN